MVRVGIVSDIHMRNEYIDEITEALTLVLDGLASRQVDHLFVLGDLIEDAESAAADEANVERVHELFERPSIPVTYLLGNHDVINLSRDTLSTILGQERFYGSIDFGDNSVIFLDSTSGGPEHPHGRLGPAQRSWLDDALRTCDDPLILCHHPLGDFDLSENVWFSEYPEQAFLLDREDVLDTLVDEGSAQGTISGHIHQTERTTFRGLSHVSANAFSKEVPDNPVAGTFVEVDITTQPTVYVKTRTETVATYTID